MKVTFYDKIKTFAGQTKGAQRKVALFLLEHTEEAAFMSIGEMALAAGVSLGTVSRATREMGFSNFAAMQQEIHQVARRNFSPVARLESGAHDTISHEHWVQHEIDNLKAVLHYNGSDSFEKASSLLIKAPAVHIMGLRSSYPVAFFMALGLEQMRGQVQCMDCASGRLPEHVHRLRSGDVMVLIAFPRYLREAVLMAEEARLSGCSIIAVTDSSFSPVARHAQVTLLAPYESGSFFNSAVGPMCIVNILLHQVAAGLKDKGRKQLEKHNAILQRWNTLVDSKDSWGVGLEETKNT